MKASADGLTPIHPLIGHLDTKVLCGTISGRFMPPRASRATISSVLSGAASEHVFVYFLVLLDEFTCDLALGSSPAGRPALHDHVTSRPYCICIRLLPKLICM
jgi:hypothetical protein